MIRRLIERLRRPWRAAAKRGPHVCETAFCRKCSGTNVQTLKLCWVDTNGHLLDHEDRVEVDFESDPGAMGYSATRWCRDCDEETSLDYVEG